MALSPPAALASPTAGAGAGAPPPESGTGAKPGRAREIGDPAPPSATDASAPSALAGAVDANSGGGSAVELELDMVNSNPSMGSVLRVVDRLHAQIAPPRPRPGGGAPDMPPWMAEVHTVFTSRSTALNVQIFLAKVCQLGRPGRARGKGGGRGCRREPVDAFASAVIHTTAPTVVHDAADTPHARACATVRAPRSSL